MRDAPAIPILPTVAALRAASATWRRAGEAIGFVPTMGALHEGHLTLVRQARAQCRRVVVSIFVNPTQFGPNSDFARYPRDLAADIAKLATVGVDAVFAPDVGEMYPDGFATTVTVAGLTDGLCGPHRPGHFAGVATVVSKLLLQCQADAAYFGEKDWQQLQVVRRLARDLDIPVRIEGVPTVREADGLAMSSRNFYLSPDERQRATVLYRTLSAMAAELAGGAPAAPAIARGFAALSKAGFDPVDYLSVVEAESLQPAARVTGPCRIAVAAWLGKTRLIDNVAVAPGA
ncbi:MAG: pantoate--beta-alanine ligase [Rhodospirillales bacterium]|nr:pantoate--beta-alanine ligase [Rhodospirillales bacterium]